MKLCRNFVKLWYLKWSFRGLFLTRLTDALFCRCRQCSAILFARTVVSMLAWILLLTFRWCFIWIRTKTSTILSMSINQSTDENRLRSSHICWSEFMFYRPTNGPRVLSKFFDWKWRLYRVSNLLFAKRDVIVRQNDGITTIISWYFSFSEIR